MAANPGSNQALARSGAQFFSFLELPPELRNNIYQMALQHDSNAIIHIVRGTRGHSDQRRPPSGDRMLHMPFLGLPQTCKAIRDEFRPLYIGEQAVPVSAVALYMYAFIEHPRKQWKSAFNVLHKTVGRLQITIDEAVETNVLPLLRLKAHHGACKIEVRSSTPEHDALIPPMIHLINNQNKTWLHLVKDGQVNAARLTTQPWVRPDNIRLRVVLRILAKAIWNFSGPPYPTEWDTSAEERRQIGLECPGLLINISYSD
jgi:hypothetical protein